MPPNPLDPDTIFRLGGWDPRYARVIRLENNKNVAFALVDANGDGAEIHESVYAHNGSQWVECFVGRGSGADGPVAWTWGTAPDRQHVEISYLQEIHIVRVHDDGIWVFVAPRTATTDNSDETEIPFRST
jgi:hypothetical protein